MNEELHKSADQFLIDLISDVTSVKEFVIEQAPDVVVQMLAWHFIGSLFAFVCYFTAIALCVKLDLWIYRSHKAATAGSYDEEFFQVIGIVAGISQIVLIPLVAIVTPLFVWLKILIVPKWYLVEYASNLVQ